LLIIECFPHVFPGALGGADRDGDRQSAGGHRAAVAVGQIAAEIRRAYFSRQSLLRCEDEGSDRYWSKGWVGIEKRFFFPLQKAI
jgi:hypothetical protein